MISRVVFATGLAALFIAEPALGIKANVAVVSGCRATDGDTIRCGGERIRLLGIDAPELPGHCRRGRICAIGDPYASRVSLRQALKGTIRLRRIGIDRYQRTLALVSSDVGDLSCWQLRSGHAIYRRAWDNGRRVAQICPRSVD